MILWVIMDQTDTITLSRTWFRTNKCKLSGHGCSQLLGGNWLYRLESHLRTEMDCCYDR